MFEISHRVFTPEIVARLQQIFREIWAEFEINARVSFNPEAERALQQSLAKRIFQTMEAGETKIESIKDQAASMMAAHCFVHFEEIIPNKISGQTPISDRANTLP